MKASELVLTQEYLVAARPQAFGKTAVGGERAKFLGRVDAANMHGHPRNIEVEWTGDTLPSFDERVEQEFTREKRYADKTNQEQPTRAETAQKIRERCAPTARQSQAYFKGQRSRIYSGRVVMAWDLYREQMAERRKAAEARERETAQIKQRTLTRLREAGAPEPLMQEIEKQHDGRIFAPDSRLVFTVDSLIDLLTELRDQEKVES